MDIDVEAAYRRFGPMVLRRCRAMLRNDEMAKEALQEVFVKLIRHQQKLEDRAMSSLLYRMATNECLNRLRGQRRRPEDADHEKIMQIAAVSDFEGESLARLGLQRIFGTEPPSTRTIAVLHFVDGMTYEEVAQAVGLSVSGVRKRLRTLSQRLNSEERQ